MGSHISIITYEEYYKGVELMGGTDKKAYEALREFSKDAIVPDVVDEPLRDPKSASESR